MEAQVWSDPQVRDLLAKEFVIVSLYVDDRERLPESEQYVSELTGRKVRTVGNKWTDFQITRYNTNSQPYYVLLNHEEEAMNKARGFNTDVEAFVKWRSEEHTSELQSRPHLVCRLLLEKKNHDRHAPD